MINKKVNDEIFDTMLRMAYEEDMDRQIAEWDALNAQKHTFSPEFEQKMKKVFVCINRPLKKKRVKRILSKVSVVFIFFIAISFIFTMSVSSLRVKVFNTFIDITDKYFGFSFGSPKESYTGTIDVNTMYVPDGYTFKSVQEKIWGSTTLFINEDGQEIRLEQWEKHEGLTIRIDSEHTKEPYTYTYNTRSLTVYITTIPSEYPSRIIWETESDFITLSGYVPVDELKKMAESTIDN